MNRYPRCPINSVLSQSEITKVAIAAPAGLHYRLAMAALSAGKDVYVEKPICLDRDEAVRLKDFAREQGRILMVGHLLHYHPCIAALKQLIRDGSLGKLHYITSIVSTLANSGVKKTHSGVLHRMIYQ